MEFVTCDRTLVTILCPVCDRDVPAFGRAMDAGAISCTVARDPSDGKARRVQTLRDRISRLSAARWSGCGRSSGGSESAPPSAVASAGAITTNTGGAVSSAAAKIRTES